MSVMIGLPCYGGNVSDKTVMGLFNLSKQFVRNDIDHALLTVANQSSVTLGRSKIANFFLNNTEFEYLFFLDSDIGFKAADVIKLLDYKLPVVCGAYPMKAYPLQWNYTLTQPNEMMGSLIKIDRIGLGFSLIHRSVFEAVAKRYPELKFEPAEVGTTPTQKEIENSYHYFSEMKIGNQFFSEDLSFYNRVKQCGIDIWMDSSIELSHVGSHVFME